MFAPKTFIALAVAGLGVLGTPAQAITNIENERPGPPRQGWSGQAELGLSGESGDVKKEHYYGAGRLTWHRDRTTVFGIAERGYGETHGLKDTDETFTHLRGIRQVTGTVAAEAFLQWQQNAFANLTSRSLAGAGGRFDLWSKPEVVSLSVGLGAFREREELDLGTHDEVNWAWRANTYAAYRHQVNPQVGLVSTLYYQPNVESSGDYRVLFDFGMNVALNASLSLKVSYALNHNSNPAVNLQANPPIDKAETNTGYSTSLVYSF